MNVTTDELFARIGRQAIELEKLREQHNEDCATIAGLLADLKTLREPAPSGAEERAQASTAGAAANGRAVEN